MTWKTVFQTYRNPEIGKLGKQVNGNTQQVSHFSLFPPFGENKKANNTSIQVSKNIDLEKLRAFLGEDWDDYKDNPESLELWADLLFKNHQIEQGKAPDNFIAVTHCKSCGYVYVPPALINGGSVLGCPWCWNRVKALPIPKPIIYNNITQAAG